MIVTESKNRKIKICDQILEEIYSQIQKNDYDPEKGGIIVGRENLNNENIILEYISKPLKNDICTRTRYTRKDEGHLKYFEKLYNENIDCLLNRKEKDISSYPQGDFDALLAFVEEWGGEASL